MMNRRKPGRIYLKCQVFQAYRRWKENWRIQSGGELRTEELSRRVTRRGWDPKRINKANPYFIGSILLSTTRWIWYIFSTDSCVDAVLYSEVCSNIICWSAATFSLTFFIIETIIGDHSLELRDRYGIIMPTKRRKRGSEDAITTNSSTGSTPPRVDYHRQIQKLCKSIKIGTFCLFYNEIEFICDQ